MSKISKLFKNNQKWAENKKIKTPNFFQETCIEQKPKYLWIGCADSRVPPTDILGLEPGEIFVHRNIANMVQDDDLNCLSCIQYGIECLNIENIIVCGHYGCGGVEASMGSAKLGMVSNWIAPIKDLYNLHTNQLDSLPEKKERFDRLVELNIEYQVTQVARLDFVQNAWNNKKKLTIYGWVYDLSNGCLKDLNCSISSSINN